MSIKKAPDALTRAVIWQPATGNVLDVRGGQVQADWQYSPADEYFTAGEGSDKQLSTTHTGVLSLVPEEAAQAIEVMRKQGCCVRAVLFGFVKHTLWLECTTPSALPVRPGIGGLATQRLFLKKKHRCAHIYTNENIIRGFPWECAPAAELFEDDENPETRTGYRLYDCYEDAPLGWQVDGGSSAPTVSMDGVITLNGGTSAVLYVEFPVQGATLQFDGNGTLEVLGHPASGSPVLGSITDGQTILLPNETWAFRVTLADGNTLPSVTVSDVAVPQNMFRTGTCNPTCDVDLATAPGWAERGYVYFFGKDSSVNWGIYRFDPEDPPTTPAVLIRAGNDTPGGGFNFPTALQWFNDRLYFLTFESGTYRIKSIMSDGSDERLEIDTGEISVSNNADMNIRSIGAGPEVLLLGIDNGKQKRGWISEASLETMVTLGADGNGASWLASNNRYVYGDSNNLIVRDRAGTQKIITGQKCSGAAWDSVLDKIYYRFRDPSGQNGAIKKCDPDLTNQSTLIESLADPDWVQDGSVTMAFLDPFIYYAIQDGAGKVDIYRINKDGTGNALVFDGSVQGIDSVTALEAGKGADEATVNEAMVGLVSVYELQTDGTDTWGEFDLSAVGGPTFVAGKRGQCVNFNGTLGQRLEIASNSSVQFGERAWTVDFWVNANSLPAAANYDVLWHKDGNFANREAICYFNGDTSTLDVEVFDGGTTLRASVTVSSSGFQGVWKHVRVQYDPSSQKVGISIDDGALTESAAATGALGVGTSIFAIGDRSNGSLGTDSKVDNLIRYNKLLSSQLATWIYTHVPHANDFQHYPAAPPSP